jgi:hemerythrin superfamily protein
MDKDIVEMLKQDHQEIRQLLLRLQGLGPDLERRQEVFRGFVDAVVAHAAAEEHALYEELRQDERCRAEVLEGYEEHHLVDLILQEMRALRVVEERWDAKFEVLRELLEHHLREEEDHLFPEVQDRYGRERRLALGARFRLFKEGRQAAAAEAVQMPEEDTTLGLFAPN